MQSHTDIPADRRAEYDALVALLMESADPGDHLAPQIAAWVSRSALEEGHLYRAMGLEDRTEVRALLERHFPEVAVGNYKDMRWKKYFYKRLCGWPGFSG